MKLIKKAIAPIFIGALVFCSLSIRGQDYLHQSNSRSESLVRGENTIIFSNNYYKRNSGFYDISQLSVYDFSKNLHSILSLRIKDWSFINSSIPLNDGGYIIGGSSVEDINIGHSRFYIIRVDSCLNILWSKSWMTNEPDGYQLDYPVSDIYIIDNFIYLQCQGTYKKNFFWSKNPTNFTTSSIWRFSLGGQLVKSIPLFTKYQTIRSYGLQKFDSTSIIQFSYGMHTRNLDQGENGWRRRPIYTILDTNLSIVKQKAFYHFSDTSATFRSHHRLNEHESLFGGNFYPRPHPYPIRNSIPFIAKVNTTTGEMLFTKNFNEYTEKRKDGYVSSFVKNKSGTVAIVTTLVNDQNGEIFDTTSISFVQFDTAYNELNTHDFRPINKELAYVDHTMQNDSITYLLASIATRPENGVVYRNKSAIFKININTFEVLDWDSVGLPTDSFCTSEVIYEDGDIDFEPFFINRSYIDSSLLSLSYFNSKTLGIYPNPAKDKIKLKENLSGQSYRITNLLGTIVAEGILDNEIDVSMLSNGLYILELSDKSTMYRAKFYKQ